MLKSNLYNDFMSNFDVCTVVKWIKTFVFQSELISIHTLCLIETWTRTRKLLIVKSVRAASHPVAAPGSVLSNTGGPVTVSPVSQTHEQHVTAAGNQTWIFNLLNEILREKNPTRRKSTLIRFHSPGNRTLRGGVAKSGWKHTQAPPPASQWCCVIPQEGSKHVEIQQACGKLALSDFKAFKIWNVSD